MKKTPTNNGKPWYSTEERKMEKLAQGNTPTGLIAHELGRSENAIRNKASEINLSLKPTNKSPYNRQKK